MALLWAFEVWIRYGLSGAHLQFISNLSLCCQSTMQHICIAGGRVSSRTNPSLWYACERQYLETELCTPSLLLSEKVSSPKTLCCPQTHLSVKGAFKFRKFSLISAHRYYAETPLKVNILTSFLKRIWVQLSGSFSGFKIGWFLWHYRQRWLMAQMKAYTILMKNWALIWKRGHFCNRFPKSCMCEIELAIFMYSAFTIDIGVD